jgi:fructose PTS system EIIBC or EIIC component
VLFRSPGLKVASQWRFTREAIDSWFAGQLQQRGPAVETATKPHVWSLLETGAVDLHLKSRTKDGILVEMSEKLASAGRVNGTQALLGALRERERLCSTGIGRGIAFLHPRHVIAEMVKEPVLGFGRSEVGIDFEAVDGEPVRLFFLDCATSERLHLAVLARLSRVLADRSVIDALLTADKPEQVVETIRRAESNIAE